MNRVFFALLIFSSPVVFATDLDEVQICLANWKEHPFKGKENTFRTLSSKVQVMGIGGEVSDDQKTKEPELIFVRPNVNVMSKTTLRLLNPNGWYCLKGKIAVLGKTEIQVTCTAQLATSTTGTTVLGSDNSDTGVTVLGKSEVRRVGCADKPKDSKKDSM